MKRTKADRQLDKQIEAIYYANCSGLVINIFDISKIFAAGRAAAAAGQDITKAVVDATLGFAADIACADKAVR